MKRASPIAVVAMVLLTTLFVFSNPGLANENRPPLSGGTITNNPLNQTITSGSYPVQLTASAASGGTGHCSVYSYQWQESSDNFTFKNINGATSQNYQPGPLTVNTYFRRKATCVFETAYTSNNAFITVILAPGYVNPSASTVNYNEIPPAMTLNAVSGQNGTYSYQWQISTDGINFSNISNATSVNYTPSDPLLVNTFYRVAVTSNGVTDYSDRATDVVCATANAGPDISLCPNGSATIGTPAISGYTYRWSPATGLSNPNIAQPTANPAQNTTYTLTMKPPNLIQNGDFEQGLTAFTTDYLTPPPGWGFNSGFITTGTGSGVPVFDCFTNHTPGGSLSLFVDGTLNANSRIWSSQTIAVTPSTNYIFSGWAHVISGTSYTAHLRVRINGVAIIQTFNLPQLACIGTGWMEFTATWPSGTSTTAVIDIIDDELHTSDNDFALDDLFFGTCLPSTDQVTVTRLTSGAPVLSGNITFGCASPPQQLTPNSLNYFCVPSECGGNVQLQSIFPGGNEWYINGVLIASSGNYAGIGNVYLWPDGKTLTHGLTTSSPSEPLFSYQLKNSLYGCNQLSTATTVFQGLTFYDNDWASFFKPNYTASVSTPFDHTVGAGSIYTWNVPNATVTDPDPSTPQASVYFPPNAPTSNITGTLTVTNSPYCNGVYNLLFEYNPNLRLAHGNTNTIIAYPNPAYSQVTIKADELITGIEIFNINYPVLNKKIKTAGSKTVTVDISNLKPGIYLCKVTTKTKTEYLNLKVIR